MAAYYCSCSRQLDSVHLMVHFLAYLGLFWGHHASFALHLSHLKSLFTLPHRRCHGSHTLDCSLPRPYVSCVQWCKNRCIKWIAWYARGSQWQTFQHCYDRRHRRSTADICALSPYAALRHDRMVQFHLFCREWRRRGIIRSACGRYSGNGQMVRSIWHWKRRGRPTLGLSEG